MNYFYNTITLLYKDERVDQSKPLHKRIKLAIVDDDENYRLLIKNIIQGNQEIFMYREYSRGYDFLRDLNSPFQPDVCLMDIFLEDISGMECCRKALEKHPDMHLIVMTAHPDIETFTQAQEMGVDYIEKGDRTENFLEKIIMSYKDADHTRLISIKKETLGINHFKIAQKLEEARERYHLLSKTQIEILKLRKEGKSVTEIADILGVKKGTIGTQLKRAYEKLELPNVLDYLEI